MQKYNRRFLLCCLFLMGFSLKCSLTINNITNFIKKKTVTVVSDMSNNPVIVVAAGNVLYTLANWGMDVYFEDEEEKQAKAE